MITEGREEGFSLVETIAALGVAAVAAAGLLAALGSASGRSAEAAERDSALRTAQFLLEEAVGVDGAAKNSGSGPVAGSQLTWTRTYDPPGIPYEGLQRVAVEVRWQVMNKKGVTRLEGYRFAPS